MVTVTSWQNQILMLQTRRSWNLTAGLVNPFLVICTGPVFMRGCCWPYTTEVSENTFLGKGTWIRWSAALVISTHNVCCCCSTTTKDLWWPSDCNWGEGLLHGASLPWHTEGCLVLWGYCRWHASRDCSKARLVSATGSVESVTVHFQLIQKLLLGFVYLKHFQTPPQFQMLNTSESLTTCNKVHFTYNNS